MAFFGNPLAGDDAFGYHVARLLSRRPPPGAQLLDLSLNPSALLDHLGDCRALLVVDAASCPGRPGKLLCLDWNSCNRPRLASDRAFSTHGLSITDQLSLAGQIGLLPPSVQLIAVTLSHTTRGRGLSRPVVRQLPAVLRLIRALCRCSSWNGLDP